MVCFNPHDAGLAHMFNAQSGSSAIGAFMRSPGMAPPPPSIPVYSACFGGGSCFATEGAYTASSIKSMKDVSIMDTIKYSAKMTFANNNIFTNIGNATQAFGSLSTLASGIFGGAAAGLKTIAG